MSISDFKNTLTGGGARANRFEVVVDFPGFAGGSEVIRKTPFLVSSASLPPSTLGVIEQPFRGRNLKLPGDREFSEWTVTFVNDTDFDIRNAFELWHNGMNGYNSNTGITNPDDVLSTFSVYQLNANDERIKEYVLRLAWPSEIGEIELAQDSNNEIETFDVTIQYSDMGSDTTT